MSKNTFFSGQPVFTQILNLIPRSLVEQVSRKYSSDHYCKKFKAYDHLVTMLYAGFFQCESLRELITGMQANVLRLQHLRLKYTPRRSTLSDANKRRDECFFGELYHQLYKIYFDLPDSRKESKEERLFILDSTTISLFSNIMQGAGTAKNNGKKKGGVKAHMVVDAEYDIPAFVYITPAKEHDLILLRKMNVPEGSRLVMDKAYINYNQFKAWNKRNIVWTTRLKRDAHVEHVYDIPVSKQEYKGGVLSDKIVLIGRPSNRCKTAVIYARVVRYQDKQTGKLFSFLTNNFQATPLDVAAIYKGRWQIEILFKRIKQRYPLRYFLGDNSNAIKIQIWTALICDLLVKIIQSQVNRIKRIRWAYASLSSMIKHHLMTYLNLKEFLIHPEKALLNYRPPNIQLNIFKAGAYF